MEMRRINMEADWGLSIDCLSAVPDQNPLMKAAQMALLAPYALAIRLNRISEERALGIWARLYAEAVIQGSPTPGYDGFDREQWMAWLLSEREAFTVLRSVCEAPENFLPREAIHGNPSGAEPTP